MVKVEEYKLPQHNISSEKFFQPTRLYLPLAQHTGKPSQPLVRKGDYVEEAQLIASQDGLISTCLHSPSKGRVVDIDEFNHPVLKRAKAIIIECDNQPKNYSLRKDIDSLSKLELLDIIKKSGIVGMGGAAFPTYVKLLPPKSIDTLIINGCECEPYLASDYRLMVEKLEGIFKGIEIIYKILEPKTIFFCIEDNKPEAIKKLNLLINTKKFKLPFISLRVLKTFYPQGGEKQLIYSVTKRRVPSSKLPFDVGCLVHNVATCFAIYEAVYWDKPLIERLVSFVGDALVSPKNLWIKIGTSLKELKEKGIINFKFEPKKIICGGPMMGIALESLDYPVLKGSGGFLFLSKEVDLKEELPCIRCARCVDACPMGLLPLEYAKRVKAGDYDKLQEFNIKDCIECGCCAYICPSNIPLVHYIKIGKRYVTNS
ncbi:MAG: electron transport complex subunit RsxC [Candidatus Omnitrophica bacterium]|nr:electron transport complex subunit RsxC [Candidatus Omnitrophota bacterium]